MNFTPNSRYQQMVMDCPQRFILAIAGKQGGKTTIGAVWLIREIYKSYVERKAKGDTSTRQWMICAPRVKTLHQATLVKFNEVLPPDWCPEGYKEQKQTYDLAWGDKIFVRSTDDPNAMEGATLSGLWLDEFGEMDLQVWSNAQARLIRWQGRCVMTTTPYIGHFWVKDQVYGKASWVNGENKTGDELDPQIAVIKWKTIDNPAISSGDIARAKKLLTPEDYELSFEAEFTSPQGLVYREFNRDHHVVKPFPIPGTWKRFNGLDFGYGSYTALISVAEKPAETDEKGKEKAPSEFYVYRELYEKNLMLPKLANAIHLSLASYTLGDPRGAQEIAELRRTHGVEHIRDADNDVELGIERVRHLLLEGRLKVFSLCTNLIDEMQSYEREADGSPHKVHDHAVDALRYAMSRSGGSIYKPSARSVRYQISKRVTPLLRRSDVSDTNSITGY